jgi:predicted nucleotidyltransferase component of viral defense system
MGGTGSKPEEVQKNKFKRVATGTSNVLNVANTAKENREQFDENMKKESFMDAAFAFEDLFVENAVPEETQTKIKDLEDLFQKLNKEIDKDFDKFREEILAKQADSLKKINLNNEQIDEVLNLSNEIIKLLGNKGSSLIVPIKDKDGKVSSVLTSSKISDPIESRAKKEEYLKKIGVRENEIDKFYQDKKTLEDYQRKFE